MYIPYIYMYICIYVYIYIYIILSSLPPFDLTTIIFSCFINILGVVFLTLIENFFRYLIIYISFKSLSKEFNVDVIKVCYIGLKPSELRYAKHDCSNCVQSFSCFFTVLYRTTLLSFGILQRLKVS